MDAPFLKLTPRQFDELASLLAWLNDSADNSVGDWPGLGWDDDRWSPDDVVTLAADAA